MNYRDQMAMAAMQGILACRPQSTEAINYKGVARAAYEMAQAMVDADPACLRCEGTGSTPTGQGGDWVKCKECGGKGVLP